MRRILTNPSLRLYSAFQVLSYTLASPHLGVRSLSHTLPRSLVQPIKRSMSTGQDSDYEHFYNYTSGRWIWDEESQLRDRYTKFNVPELKQLAAKSVGANACVGISKLAEGSFNKVFRLVMDNTRVAIARIPHPNAVPRYYTTASEVATMDFARTVLRIPVPEVYSWSASIDNPVGSEYIIMAEASGAQAADSWEKSELEDKVKVMKDLISVEKKLASLSFNRYGSLYYAKDSIEGSIAAEVTGDISDDVRNDVSARFTIGPTTEKSFWSGERSSMDIDRGPWKDSRDYVTAIARREIAWLEQYAVPRDPSDPLVTSAAQNSPNEHISLLKKYLAVAPYLLPTDSDLLASHIWHRDLHSGNIFITDSHITDVIDWQGVWAGPLFLQARHPKLIDYRGEVLLKFPADFKEVKDEVRKAQIRKQVASSIILHLYEANTAKSNPLLNKVFHVGHGRTRSDPIVFAGDTWDDDILPFRESLVRVEKYWNEMGNNSPCPIHFTEAELRSHEKDSEGWNDVQDFWDSIAGMVARDGWTSHETYDEAVKLFSELRESGLKTMTGKERRLFDKQTRWADDLKN